MSSLVFNIIIASSVSLSDISLSYQGKKIEEAIQNLIKLNKLNDTNGILAFLFSNKEHKVCNLIWIIIGGEISK